MTRKAFKDLREAFKGLPEEDARRAGSFILNCAGGVRASARRPKLSSADVLSRWAADLLRTHDDSVKGER